ncbi:MAG TPA: DNA polymerase III subunit alpha [Bacilli bacterium]
MRRFVHLHVHSEYSLLDGAARLRELVATAAELGMDALALTDHGVMYGVIPFYKACREHGIKPIIGCEMYMATGSLKEKASRAEQPTTHLTLLAKNEQGYRNLLKLVSIAHLEGFYYKPRIDFAHLSAHAEGLICLSGCMSSRISRDLLAGKKREARATALRYRELFGDDYYLEIQDHGLLEQKKLAQDLIALSRETGIPLVATNDAHYLRQEDAQVQDVLLCIGTGKTVEDENRLKMSTDQMFLKSAAQMERLFAHIPEALNNTWRIADKCSLELEFGKSVLPAFKPIPDALTASQYLRKLCLAGLKERYMRTARWTDPAQKAELINRLEYELQIIDSMGYSDYFLIVWDFVRFAYERNIAVGPGRGSSAGSLVAYVLKITNVDPIRYRLLFERFLNPERVSMPDIDIDFSDERRDEVIDYVVEKYGKEHVAQIITFGTMAARAAVRDVGRVLNMPYNEVDKAAKMIPNQLGMTIADALRANPDLQELCRTNGQAAELIDMAQKVEGMPRHASTHAAGVVISREPLNHYVPLQQGSEKTALTQYPMEHLEQIGLLKMDFLGLRTLSIIERCLRWIRDAAGECPDLSALPDDDAATYELLGKGDTTGIFQLESAGMRRVLKDLRPSSFEDIISVLALYRPGPMEFIPKFIQAKHGEIAVHYPHPTLEPILSDTYGIIVYQEQIMQIASQMAGFRLGEADLLRRAVSKKKRDVLDKEREHFVSGCVRQGHAADIAERVYDMIVRFADYGFPRAHATAYGVLAYQTAYLKAHFPVQFMASMLTAVMGNQRKIAEYIDECRRMGIPVLPPDVNESGNVFTPLPPSEKAPRGAIRFGLAAIKNVGLHAIESIMEKRAEQPFIDLADLCRRVDLKACNKRVLESLVQCGALDSLPGHRAQLFMMLDECVESAQTWKKEKEDFQIQLFGLEEEVNWEIAYPDVREYTNEEKLELEHELLGLYLSGHPLDEYRELLDRLAVEPLHLLAETPDGKQVIVAGMVAQVKQIVSKKGLPMAFVEFEDNIMKTEVVVFPETWKRCGDKFRKGALLLILAKLQQQDEDFKLLAENAYALDDPHLGKYVEMIRKRNARPNERRRRSMEKPAPPTSQAAASKAGNAQQRVFVKISRNCEQPGRLVRLRQLLREYSGRTEVVLYYERDKRLLALNRNYHVQPSDELFRGIEQIMGRNTVALK